MDLLEEGNLLLQALDASLQVQPGQRGVVHILEVITEQQDEDGCNAFTVALRQAASWR